MAVKFLVPILPRMKAKNWPLIGELLNGTLGSLAAQTDQNFEVIVCVHERPDVDAFPGMKLRFIEADWPAGAAKKDRYQDKWWKKRMLGAAAREHGAGYVMMLDGDDRVSSRLVEHVHQQADPHGYLIKTGYALDYRNGTLGPLPGVWDKTFDQACGSCAIWNLSPDDLPSHSGDKGANYWDNIRSHRGIEALAKSCGRPLADIPFPAAIYAQNTSVNSHDKVLRARAAAVAGEIAAHAVPLTNDLIAEFALSDVLKHATGQVVSAIHQPLSLLDRLRDRFFTS